MSLQYEPGKFWDSPPRLLGRWIYRLARVDMRHEAPSYFPALTPGPILEHLMMNE